MALIISFRGYIDFSQKIAYKKYIYSWSVSSAESILQCPSKQTSLLLLKQLECICPERILSNTESI